jgi:hypothetical protein
MKNINNFTRGKKTRALFVAITHNQQQRADIMWMLKNGNRKIKTDDHHPQPACKIELYALYIYGQRWMREKITFDISDRISSSYSLLMLIILTKSVYN